MKKINTYQKLVLGLFSALVMLSCIFIVPFNENGTNRIKHDKENKQIDNGERNEEIINTPIVYKSIWSDGNKISSQRLIIELIVIVIFCGSLFFILGNMKSPDFKNPNVKRFIKRELKIFISFILFVLLLWGGLALNGFIVEKQRHKLTEKYYSNKDKIKSLRVDILNKKQVRNEFYNSIKNYYDLDWTNNKVSPLWNGLVNDDIFYDINGERVKMTDDIIKNKLYLSGHVFGNKEQLFEFLQKYSFTTQDIENDKKASQIAAENKDNNDRQHRLSKNNTIEIQNLIIKIAILILFLTYPIRIFIYYLKRLFNYLKN